MTLPFYGRREVKETSAGVQAVPSALVLALLAQLPFVVLALW